MLKWSITQRACVAKVRSSFSSVMASSVSSGSNLWKAGAEGKRVVQILVLRLPRNFGSIPGRRLCGGVQVVQALRILKC